MQSLDYFYAQLRLEGKGFVSPDRLTRLPAADEDVPLMLIVRLTDGNTKIFFDELLSAEIQDLLLTHTLTLQFPVVEPIRQMLHEHRVPTQLGHFRTYLFPAQVAPPDAPVQQYHQYRADDPKLRAFNFAGFATPVFAIEQVGQIVSACVSVRENDQCGEAWVYTATDHRRQGLARKIVAAWAQSLIGRGKTPFYSHKIDNHASASVAQRLRLLPIFESVSIAREA